MGHQEHPRDPDKSHSGRYEAFPIQSLLGHTTPDNENPFHYQKTQLIEMRCRKPGYILST